MQHSEREFDGVAVMFCLTPHQRWVVVVEWELRKPENEGNTKHYLEEREPPVIGKGDNHILAPSAFTIVGGAP